VGLLGGIRRPLQQVAEAASRPAGPAAAPRRPELMREALLLSWGAAVPAARARFAAGDFKARGARARTAGVCDELKNYACAAQGALQGYKAKQPAGR
jgi:hypothetical protein